MIELIAIQLSDVDAIEGNKDGLISALSLTDGDRLFVCEDTDLSSTSGYVETVLEELAIIIQCNPTTAHIKSPEKLLDTAQIGDLGKTVLAALSRGSKKYVSMVGLLNVVPLSCDLVFFHLCQYLDDAKITSVIRLLEIFGFEKAYLIEYDVTVLERLGLKTTSLAIEVSSPDERRSRLPWYGNTNW